MLARMIWPFRQEAQIVLFVDDAAIEAALSGHRKISSCLRHSRFYEIKNTLVGVSKVSSAIKAQLSSANE